MGGELPSFFLFLLKRDCSTSSCLSPKLHESRALFFPQSILILIFLFPRLTMRAAWLPYSPEGVIASVAPWQQRSPSDSVLSIVVLPTVASVGRLSMTLPRIGGRVVIRFPADPTFGRFSTVSFNFLFDPREMHFPPTPQFTFRACR